MVNEVTISEVPVFFFLKLFSRGHYSSTRYFSSILFFMLEFILRCSAAFCVGFCLGYFSVMFYIVVISLRQATLKHMSEKVTVKI